VGVRDHKFVVHAITIPLAQTHYAHPLRVGGSLRFFLPGPHGMQRRSTVVRDAPAECSGSRPCFNKR
jgi:hypothetical protein